MGDIKGIRSNKILIFHISKSYEKNCLPVMFNVPKLLYMIQ